MGQGYCLRQDEFRLDCMDKTTKNFVIAACSVVIAAPVVWLGVQVINGINRAQQQRLQDELRAEQIRQSQRYGPCSRRIDREGARLLDETEGWRGIQEKTAWTAACQKSFLPIAEFE